MFKKILVSVDLAEKGSFERLMPVAEALAEQHSADLHVLTVVPTYSMPIVGSYFPEGREEEAITLTQQALKEKLAERSFKGNLKGHVANGSIYDEIIRAADKLGCELIVMASHRPDLKDYLLGPNAARVVRHAKQSVFVVRAAE